MVYKYPAWRGMEWFGRILLLGWEENLGCIRFAFQERQQSGQGRPGEERVSGWKPG